VSEFVQSRRGGGRDLKCMPCVSMSGGPLTLNHDEYEHFDAFHEQEK
jgi:hypothetical protein